MNQTEIDREIKRILKEHEGNTNDQDYFLCKYALSKYWDDGETCRYIVSHCSSLTEQERKVILRAEQ